MLRALRQRNGDYEPEKLAQITRQGGSEIYMMLTEVKCRAAESWLFPQPLVMVFVMVVAAAGIAAAPSSVVVSPSRGAAHAALTAAAVRGLLLL